MVHNFLDMQISAVFILACIGYFCEIMCVLSRVVDIFSF